MANKIQSIEEYIKSIPTERIESFTKLRKTILTNLPKGFVETISYGMIGYVVPHSIYPKGYHCDPKQPLPFIYIASHKNFISLYHMGLYADKKLSDWFTHEYSKHCTTKPDIGKSCIRFKKIDQIPYKLIGELAQKISVKNWVTLYEKSLL